MNRRTLLGQLILTLALAYALSTGHLGPWPETALIVSLLRPRP